MICILLFVSVQFFLFLSTFQDQHQLNFLKKTDGQIRASLAKNMKQMNKNTHKINHNTNSSFFRNIIVHI